MTVPVKRPYILCVGLTPALQEIRRFDRFTPGEVNRSRSVTQSAAGKGINTARVIGTLGGPPLATGFIGGDTGDRILADLDRWGVQHNFVTIQEQTRVCVTLIDEAGGGVTELVEEAKWPGALAWKRFLKLYSRIAPGADFVLISGTLMPGASEKAYGQFVKLAGPAPVIIDSQKTPLLNALPLHPLVAKLNVHELENTTGRPLRSESSILRASRSLLAAGAQNVLVTNGAEGAWLVEPDRVWLFVPPRLKAVNPIGSGDAVTAGLAFGLWKGMPLPDAVRLGIASGSANALTLEPGCVRKSDVRRILPQIRIRNPEK